MKRLLKSLLFLGLLAAATILIITGCMESGSEEESDITVESVIASLQPINELATLKVGVAGVVRASHSPSHWWQGTNQLVIVGRGNALYAIDLAQLDIMVNDRELRLNLPQPRVIDAWIDLEDSAIWDQRRGFLRGNDFTDLQRAAWQEAQTMVYRAGHCDRYQRAAKRSAERLIADLLRPYVSPRQITIEWREIPAELPVA
jgi:hypothetical protein